MITKIVCLLSIIYYTSAFSMSTTSFSPFNNWHSIDFVKNIDKTKPFSYNVGDLPLVTWFNKNDKPLSTINICQHMGSKLNEGNVEEGCLKCPYHGLEYNEDKTFGDTMIFQEKLWWSYNPVKKTPPSIPFYNNKNYETSYIKLDVNANIIDCAFNTMDVNHPAYIHNNIFGFGSKIPPSNLKTIKYPKNSDKIGLSFNYISNNNIAHLKRELRKSKNFHVYEFPYTTWSRVTLPTNEELFVNVNMLPIARNKTRWLITLKHNFWKSSIEKRFMNFAADCILYQDKQQMNRQENDSILKSLVMNQVSLRNEEHFEELKQMFKKYKYPDYSQVVLLYNQYLSNIYNKRLS